MAANARHIWDGDWKRTKRRRKLRLDKLVSAEISGTVGSYVQVDQNSESGGHDSSTEVMDPRAAAFTPDRYTT